jgi:HEAT repeat protein
MKTLKRISVVTIIVLISFFELNAADIQLNSAHKAVGNLLMGIKSENDGLKRNAIYLAGKYRLVETGDALVEQYSVEKEPGTKILIAHAIFRIHDDNAMEKIYNMSISDKNPKVRRLTAAIYETYKLDNYNFEEFMVINK